MDKLWCMRVGQVPYEPARRAQKRLEAARLAGEIPDLLLLLEHPPVYTKGRRSDPAELGMGEDWYRMQGIDVAETDRGGRVTYHGPGQLVGYPIISLKEQGEEPPEAAAPGSEAEDARRVDVVAYLRRMERVMIESLGEFGVEAQVIEGLTGVWTAGPRPGPDRGAGAARKIGSIGVHVNRGVTTHGFAINVNNDLQPFEWIVPCGIDGCRMTSVCGELGAEQEMAAFADTVSERFASVYGRRASPISAAELAQRVAGIDALAGAAEPAGNGTAAALR